MNWCSRRLAAAPRALHNPAAPLRHHPAAPSSRPCRVRPGWLTSESSVTRTGGRRWWRACPAAWCPSPPHWTRRAACRASRCAATPLQSPRFGRPAAAVVPALGCSCLSRRAKRLHHGHIAAGRGRHRKNVHGSLRSAAWAWQPDHPHRRHPCLAANAQVVLTPSGTDAVTASSDGTARCAPTGLPCRGHARTRGSWLKLAPAARGACTTDCFCCASSPLFCVALSPNNDCRCTPTQLLFSFH